VTLIDAVQQS